MAGSESRIEALATALELAADFEVPVVDQPRPEQRVMVASVRSMGVAVTLPMRNFKSRN